MREVTTRHESFGKHLHSTWRDSTQGTDGRVFDVRVGWMFVYSEPGDKSGGRLSDGVTFAHCYSGGRWWTARVNVGTKHHATAARIARRRLAPAILRAIAGEVTP